MNKQNGVTLVESIVIVTILLIVASMPILMMFNLNTNRGSHTGYITAVDQKGIFFRNYTVYFKTGTSSSQEDTYCINRSNPRLADKIEELSKQKKLVTITYKGFTGFAVAPCRGDEIKSVD